jgi:hypothetical protein
MVDVCLFTPKTFMKEFLFFNNINGFHRSDLMDYANHLVKKYPP